MADKQFIIDLAKLLIASAWADGHLQSEEINSLKDLLFNLEDVTGDDWAHLEIYMDSPVGPEETSRLLNNILEHIKSQEDKNFVVETLEKLFQADGVITDQEAAVLQQIKSKVSDVSTTMFTKLSKMIKAAMGKRGQGYISATQRESQIDDFIENTIYYQLKSEVQKGGIEIDLPEQKLRQLCLAAGLLARISAVDSEISEKEKQSIENILAAQWALPRQQAHIVAEISCDRTLRGLDYFRLTRNFFDCTTVDQRKDFVKCLFQIANASNKTSYDETEEIRRIANSLKLSHKDFIEAKLTIPDEDREVL